MIPRKNRGLSFKMLGKLGFYHKTPIFSLRQLNKKILKKYLVYLFVFVII